MSALRDRLLFLGILASGALGAAGLFWARPPPPVAPAEPDAAPPSAAVSAKASVSASPPKPPPPPYVREGEGADVACGADMILVDGIYCPFVGHTCARFADEARDICETYGPDVLCEGRLVHRRFCIDRFEYPNLEGALPAVSVTFDEAARACSIEGKRLCGAEEWEFACEGAGMWPYPYGRVRDAHACNVDHAGVTDGRAAAGELAGCISPFGMRDATGNVDEWVVNEQGKNREAPFRSALKGGSWAPSRAACRPTTTTFGPTHRAVDVGFRCCKDARGTPRPVEAAPGATRPKKSRMP